MKLFPYDTIETLKAWANAFAPSGGYFFTKTLLKAGIYAGTYPKGKGAFLSAPGAYGSPNELIALCKDANLSYLLFDPRFDGIEKYSIPCNKAGIQAWLWSMPTAANVNVEHVQFLYDTAAKVGAWGIVSDPEADYQGQPEAAAELASLLKQVASPYLGVGVTSYGQAYMHGRFPWTQLGGVGFGMPQTYLYAANNPGSTTKAIEEWKKYGWRYIIPAVPVWSENEDGKRNDPAKLIALLDECKAAGCPGVAAWSLIHKSSNPELWQTFAQYEW